MKRVVNDYSIDVTRINYSDDALKSPVDQSVVGSVFIIDPITGSLKDCLSQVVQDPSNPRNPELLKMLEPVGNDSPTGLSDDELMSMLRSRYAQSPSEVTRYSEMLQTVVNEGLTNDTNGNETNRNENETTVNVSDSNVNPSVSVDSK